MFDYDLARLYNVETKVLKQAVKRNLNRFPDDFMFELTKVEYEDLRSQIVTSNVGGTRYMPMAFTEHGVLMLSSVLKSQRAIDVNIQIVRIFSKMRKLLMSHKELLNRVSNIELNLEDQSYEIRVLFDYLKNLMNEKDLKKDQDSRSRIGYKQN